MSMAGIAKYERAAGLFRCPVCARRAQAGAAQADATMAGAAQTAAPRPAFALVVDGSCLRCAAGHTFDIARKGLVNFIPGQKPLAGYDAAFFASRREFLQWGYYAHVRQAIVERLEALRADGLLPDAPVILDAGCGEGYYARGIGEALAGAGVDATMIGADIAKDAVRLAATGGGPQLWAVCDVANLPVADAALDCVLNIFTPANYAEFRRVLRPGGIVIKAIPGPDHLRELRERLGEADHSESDVVSIFRSRLEPLARIRATRTLDVPSDRMHTLLGMTPLTFALDDARLDGLEVPRITIDAELLVGRSV